MERISAEVVERYFEEFAEMGSDPSEALMADFQKDQPEVLAYLFSVGEDILEEEERETLVLSGLMIWGIMHQQGALPKPDGSTLDEAESAQFKLLEALHQGNPSDPESLSDAAEDLLDDYHQENLLALVEDLVLFPDPEQPDDIEDENRPWLFIFLKTLIDCWDAK